MSNYSNFIIFNAILDSQDASSKLVIRKNAGFIMDTLKESSDYLEGRIESTKKEIDEITYGSEALQVQIDDARRQIEDIESRSDNIKVNFKITVLIAALLGFGLPVILAYYSKEILALAISVPSALYIFKRYKTYIRKYNGLDHERRSIYEKQEELNNKKDDYQKRLGQIAKKFDDYTKGLAGEQLVSNMLKTLGQDNYLINDIMLHRPFGNIDHILISPHGIFVIETKNWGGYVLCDGDEWKRHFEGNFKSIDYPLESLSIRVKGNAAKLSQLIKSKLYRDSMDVWVEGIIIFVNPDIKLSITNSAVSVLKVENMCKYIQHQKPETNFSSRDLQSIANFLQKELMHCD